MNMISLSEDEKKKAEEWRERKIKEGGTFSEEMKKMEDEMQRKIKMQSSLSKYFDGERFKAEFMAEEFMESFKIITLNGTDEMLFYDNKEGIYKEDAEFLVRAFCEQELPTIKSYFVSEVINHIKRRTYIHRNKIGEDKFKIHLQNGIFDLKEMKLYPFDPNFVSLIKIPILYSDQADCPVFKKFLKEIIKDEDVPLIQELFGYSLWRDYPLQKAFMCIGEGRNGKSTLLAVMKTMLGTDNVCSVSLQELEHRFSTSYFYNKMANIHADLPAKSMENTGKFKMLTGGDTMIAEVKNKMGFPFVNYAKMVFACNKLPEVSDNTIAFFRRWIIINFPNSFEEGGNADENLLQKMTTPEELSGLLNWSIDGLKRLLFQRKFSTKVTPEQMGELYQRMADSLYAFVTDCIEATSEEDAMTKAELYEKYTRYCIEKNYPTKTKEVVGKTLTKYIPATECYHGRERAWYGIRIKQENKNQSTISPSPTNEETIIEDTTTKTTLNTIPEPNKRNFNRIELIKQCCLGCLFPVEKGLIDYFSLEKKFIDQFIVSVGREPTEEELLEFHGWFDQQKKEGMVFEPRKDLYQFINK